MQPAQWKAQVRNNTDQLRNKAQIRRITWPSARQEQNHNNTYNKHQRARGSAPTQGSHSHIRERRYQIRLEAARRSGWWSCLGRESSNSISVQGSKRGVELESRWSKKAEMTPSLVWLPKRRAARSNLCCGGSRAWRNEGGVNWMNQWQRWELRLAVRRTER
jgi:hypothetical protein